MVGPGEVDDDLQPEVVEECNKYGDVAKVIIYEVSYTGTSKCTTIGLHSSFSVVPRTSPLALAKGHRRVARNMIVFPRIPAFFNTLWPKLFPRLLHWLWLKAKGEFLGTWLRLQEPYIFVRKSQAHAKKLSHCFCTDNYWNVVWIITIWCLYYKEQSGYFLKMSN